MTLKKSYVYFAVFIVLSLGLYFYVHGGYYPAVVVNYHIITARVVGQYYVSAVNYLRASIATYGGDAGVLQDENSLKEIKRGILGKLTEDYLIYKEAKNRAGNDLNSIVENKIGNLGTRAQLEQAASSLYGLSYDEFADKVLRPQAYKEIVQDRMFLNGEDYDKWLADAKKNASVIILINGFGWNGEDVKISN